MCSLKLINPGMACYLSCGPISNHNGTTVRSASVGPWRDELAASGSQVRSAVGQHQLRFCSLSTMIYNGFHTMVDMEWVHFQHFLP